MDRRTDTQNADNLWCSNRLLNR